jgi:hypothetical protein
MSALPVHRTFFSRHATRIEKLNRKRQRRRVVRSRMRAALRQRRDQITNPRTRQARREGKEIPVKHRTRRARKQ